MEDILGLDPAGQPLAVPFATPLAGPGFETGKRRRLGGGPLQASNGC